MKFGVLIVNIMSMFQSELPQKICVKNCSIKGGKRNCSFSVNAKLFNISQSLWDVSSIHTLVCFRISNNIEETVLRIKEIPHCAVEFEAGDKTGIKYSLYWRPRTNNFGPLLGIVILGEM